MHVRYWTAALLAAVCLTLAANRTEAALVTFSTSQSQFTSGIDNQGWWSDVHTNSDGNSNYFTGIERRGFFTFDLSSLGASDNITSATLNLRRGTSGFNEATEDVGFFDVTTAAATLNNNNGVNATIYADLGSGVSYGTFTVSGTEDQEAVLSFTLNDAGVAAVNAAKGQFLSIGADLLTQNGNDWIFGSTNGTLDPQDLVLNIEPAQAPVPEPATLTIWSLGALGCAVAAYRLRKNSTAPVLG